MNSNIKTGGPAFPTDNAHQTGPHSYHAEGMTLRDWFAGMALQGLLLDPDSMGATEESNAEFAYKVADAMIKAREAA